MKNLKVQIKKLVQERGQQNIEQKIKELKNLIVSKQGELNQANNDLKIDSSAECQKSNNVRNQINNSLNNN